MSKPIIAVDVDDVLVRHFQDLIDWYNHKYGTKLTPLNNNGDDPLPWGTSSVVEAITRVQGFFDAPEFTKAAPSAEAILTIKHVSERYELVVLSARDLLIEQFTRTWLDKYFAGLFTAAYFTARYSLEAKARSKTDLILEIGASYLIDDTLRTVTNVARAGVETVLFGDYPWNQAAELPERVTRCKDWAAVQEYFDGR